MSLVRCPGCKLDTSDSLAHCPNCGRAFHGAAPRETASFVSTTMPEPSSPAAPGAGPSSQTKAIGFVILLVVLAVVPHSLPFVVMAVVFWLLANRQRSSAKRSTQTQLEALKVLVSEVSRARNQGSQVSRGSSERPLEMLGRIERQLKK